MYTINGLNIKGLSQEEVLNARKKYGYNILVYKKAHGLIYSLVSLMREPMIILLVVASLIYFISGDMADGIFLAFAIVFEAGISLFQNTRSRNALEKLKDLSAPACTVIRSGNTEDIKSEEIVVGDVLVITEGSAIPADGIIIHSNDFSVNESVLTGESLPVLKDSGSEDNHIYKGTTVSGGLAVARITAIGNTTRLGKIGKSLEAIKEEKTPLEVQINHFIKGMTIAGSAIFSIVWAINYFRSFNILDSLLKALTLAMSIIPEEIPVAFTTFMALGGWRMMKLGILVKQMKTVETLGSATVICTDKTGTITENRMSLAKLFVFKSQKIVSASISLGIDEIELITLAMWASEPVPFDPMEVAIHKGYKTGASNDQRLEYKMISEYPLEGKPPMMTHVFENKSGKRIIAAKGAPEAIMNVSNMSVAAREQIEQAIHTLAADGYRLLAVGEAHCDDNNLPVKQQDFLFTFKGILAFYDPPRENMQAVLQEFYKAGISVKIITGDNVSTSIAIAKQIKFEGYEKNLSGDELMMLSDDELKRSVIHTNLFTRMFPEAKLKIINALKANNEIVAMTGDGVNDGPALKAAHIGIAMGKKGTEIAKQAASLILLEDDFSKMVDAIAMGRKIYANLKKAIQYIISIHIPIILTVFVPLALGWVYPNIFSPIHIIFLELIMGPTCSIIYENEPMEQNTMTQKPRPLTRTFFNGKELLTSIMQGLAITAGALFAYRVSVYQGFSEPLTRTVVFTVLIVANMFLTLVNRSFYYSFIITMRYKNNLVLLILVITIAFLMMVIYVRPLTQFFKLEQLSTGQFLMSASIGFLSVIWFEAAKWIKRKRQQNL